MIPSPSLPDPPAEDRAHSRRVGALISERIAAGGGWLSFADYMQVALYAPSLGYYSAGSRKLGADGDFVTAPEISPLFGAAIARQAAQVMRASNAEILELGAGSGALAATLLAELAERGSAPVHYRILEVSADLRDRQQTLIRARVPHLAERVQWLERLPESFSGLVLANEVLDAMPIHLFEWREGAVAELGVALGQRDGRDGHDGGRDGIGGIHGFEWSTRPAQQGLAAIVRRLAHAHQWSTPYRSEVGLIAQAFVATVARMLTSGAALFIDYGFAAREYYHPQRAMGTLRCHYRHRVHDDPLFLPGLCDITAHVDFSAIAEHATGAGLELAGFTTQAHFLINCGITDLLLRTPPDDAARYLPQANAAQRLLSPAEMGELFKAIVFTKGVDAPLLGFTAGDRRATL
jgi:SAM-dependent MidA family methyltransferase